MMFLLGFVFIVVTLQNWDNMELYDCENMSFPYSLPPYFCTVNVKSRIELADKMVMIPNANLSSVVELTIELSQFNITDSADENLECCAVDTNVTSHNEFVDLMVVEPNTVVLSTLEPPTVDLSLLANVTYGADTDLEQCAPADKMTSQTELWNEISMGASDLVLSDVSAQALIILGTALKGSKLFTLAALFDTVYLAVMFLMASGYLYQRMKLTSLHKEFKKIVKQGIATVSLTREVEKALDSQQSDLTRLTFRNAKLNRKINTASSELDEVQNDLERLYEDLNAWKQEWMEQSHSIRQINTDYLQQLSDQPSSQVDRFIEQQEQEMRDAAHYFGEQFYVINQVLDDRQRAIMSMEAEIDAIHDVLNEESASQF